MLLGAVLVPDTALLVPGAAGRAEVLTEARERACAAVEALVRRSGDVLVLVPGRPDDAVLLDEPAPGPPGLAAAGGPDGRPAQAATGVRGGGSERRGPVDASLDVPTAVGRWLLARTGRPVRLRRLRCGGTDGPALQEAGRRAAATGGVALVLGSPSARAGAEAPLPEHPGADALDREVLADLERFDAAARTRLAAVPAGRAHDAALNLWGPVQALLGAAPAGRARVDAWVGADLGTRQAVVSWTWEGR